jgi:cell wall-associated NlpC family hydrolase
MVMVCVLTLTACTAGTSQSSALAQTKQLNIKTALAEETKVSPLQTAVVQLTLLQQQQRAAQKLVDNKIKIMKAVKKVKKYSGKTWYAFSGSSPYGWDCSGLVRWTYEQMGVTLEHSATKQMRSGKVVKYPVIGDIVAFYYPGSKSSFHVGIYVGNGKMIHSYRPGVVTQIESVAGIAKGNRAKYKYVRILPQPAVITATAAGS